MPLVSDINPLESVPFLLFAGESGCGKTCAAASFPKPIVMDCDSRIQGTLPLVRKGILIDPIEYKNWAPPAGWAHFSKYAEELKMNCLTYKGKYSGPKTFIWDSLTNMCNLLIEEAMDLQKGNIIKNPYDETVRDVKSGGKSPDDKDYGKFSLRVPGPSDYKYEGQGVYQLLSILRGLNTGIWGVSLNMIFTAHVINLYGKPENEKTHETEQYADNVVVGKKISLRDRVLTNILTVFNEVYYFEKTSKNRFTVTFNSEVARSVLVPNDITVYDITDKNFYKFWSDKIAANYPQKAEIIKELIDNV